MAVKMHHLKCWPEPFEAMLRLQKSHEFRRDDGRDFAVGDVLYLREYDPSAGTPAFGVGAYTGFFIERRITYITRGPDFGVPEGFVAMSVEPLR